MARVSKTERKRRQQEASRRRALGLPVAGRPPKQNVDRTESGRISRANINMSDNSDVRDEYGAPVKAVAVAARIRHHKLPERIPGKNDKGEFRWVPQTELAAYDSAGTVLGRLFLWKKIDLVLLTAGERFRASYQNMRRAIEAPVALAVSSGVSNPESDWAVMGEVETANGRLPEEYMSAPQLAYTERAIAAVARYEVAKTALEDIGCFSVVESVVLNEEEEHADSPLLIAGLKLLARKFNLEKEPEAA